MPRSTSQTASISFVYAPVSLIEKLQSFFVEMVRSEPAARAAYAENAKVRMGGRNWLM